MAGYRVIYASERRSWRDVRRIVRAALRRGIEPEPRYRTGRFWTD